MSAAAAPSTAQRFRVTGMRDASCASRIELLLCAHDGVESASVSFDDAEARVVGAPNPTALRAELARAGYALFGVGQSEAAPAARGPENGRLLRAALLTLPLLGLTALGIEFPRSGWLQALLASPVVLICGAEFHLGAWRALRRRAADMDTLVSLGTLLAWAASVDGLLRGGPLFFESAAVITSLVLLGRNLEARARGHASRAVTRLAALRADVACVRRSGGEQTIPVAELQVGDLLVVGPGEKVPTDSVVIDGHSVLDESMFTGEPKPRPCAPGDELRGASRNGAGRLVARSIRVGGDTILAGVQRMLAETQGSRAPVERWADSVAAWFVPVVLLISCGTALVWLQQGLDPVLAFTRALAVLVVACPCALGLATPTALIAAAGRGAELGILFKGGEAFARARRVDVALFDKTGTLTRGELTLDRLLGCEGAKQEQRLLQLAASVEAACDHAIATAIVEGAEERAVLPLPVSRFEAVPGRGVVGKVGKQRVRIGAPDWLEEQDLTLRGALRGAVHEAESQGHTVVLCAAGEKILGGFVLEDELRDHARETVESIQRMGIAVELISGDNERAARRLADALGIDEVIAGARPADKAAAVKIHQERGHRVAFVGDGVHDAPALGQADLGLAIGTGSDVALEGGGAVLVSGDPRLAATALRLARRTATTIRQNLFWACVYNGVAIPLAVQGQLGPMLAAGAMALSSVAVVLNSLRLRH